MPPQLLRMIDANVNRACEGLRVMEDVARFTINDPGLSQRLRASRHDLATDTKPLLTALLSERDSEYDVGRHAHPPPISVQRTADTGAGSTADLLGLLTANAKRVQQALRVIEELAKTPELSLTLDSRRFQQTRFTLYAIERDLFSRISRRDKLQQIQGLYVILDRQFVAGRDELEIARQVIDGGANVIQLRDKLSSKRELLAVAEKIKELCHRARILFIVDDHLDIALASEADGLHIGQMDLPLPVVRRRLPVDRIVGCSVTTVSQAKTAHCEGADYIAVGSIFPTATKRDATVVGAATLREVKQSVSVPVVAIGGIDEGNISEVVSAGADAVAVVSTVLREEDVAAAVKNLLTEMDMARGR